MAPPCEGFFLCSLRQALISRRLRLCSLAAVPLMESARPRNTTTVSARDLFFSFFFLFFCFLFSLLFYPLLGCRVVNPRVGDPGGAGLGALVSGVVNPGEQGWLPWYIYIYIL